MASSSQKRIGILGGTFNPVHTGHLVIAQSAMEAFGLGRVVFIPCSEPPHKRTSFLVPARHRLNMLKAAIAGDPRFETSSIEIERGGTSYAIDTIRQLKKILPGRQLFFIIGSDTLQELYLWKDIYKLLKLCKFAAIERPGFDIKSITPEKLHLDPPWPEKLLETTAAGCQIAVSSSDVRRKIAGGMSIRYLVPPKVEAYIVRHNLYDR